MTREDFYSQCATILDVDIEVKDTTIRKRYNRKTGKVYMPNSNKTRWGPRTPGNGRYPGYGTIKVFSSVCIKLDFTNPKLISKTFTNYDEALQFLKDNYDQQKT